jgi:hypothetical protein
MDDLSVLWPHGPDFFPLPSPGHVNSLILPIQLSTETESEHMILFTGVLGFKIYRKLTHASCDLTLNLVTHPILKDELLLAACIPQPPPWRIRSVKQVGVFSLHLSEYRQQFVDSVFRRVKNCEKRPLASSCPCFYLSVRPHGTTQLSLDRF